MANISLIRGELFGEPHNLIFQVKNQIRTFRPKEIIQKHLFSI